MVHSLSFAEAHRAHRVTYNALVEETCLDRDSPVHNTPNKVTVFRGNIKLPKVLPNVYRRV
jgi:hypothetical protein